MTKHTPTPWHVEPNIGDEGTTTIYSGGEAIAVMENDFPRDEANAALIVRAVNAHDDLVAALRAIAEALDVPRNRFGKLEVDFEKGAAVQALVRKYAAEFPEIIPNGGEDKADQCRMVARAALAKATADA